MIFLGFQFDVDLIGLKPSFDKWICVLTLFAVSIMGWRNRESSIHRPESAGGAGSAPVRWPRYKGIGKGWAQSARHEQCTQSPARHVRRRASRPDRHRNEADPARARTRRSAPATSA